MRAAFLQSNWQRQYPIKSSCNGIDLNGNIVPTDILVGLRISSSLGNLDVYVSKLVTNEGVVGVEFFSNTGFLGSASGMITVDNQNLSVVDSIGSTIGNVTIGNPDSCVAIQSFNFDITTGAVEPSTITCLSVPGVSGITVKSETLTGSVVLASTTINISTTSGINLSVINPNSITSREDYQASYLTCPNTVIGGINSVVPDGVTNNIDIFAIAPLVINNTSGGGITQFTLTVAPLSLATLCETYNIPPTNSSDAVSPPLESASPEYLTWPQFS